MRAFLLLALAALTVAPGRHRAAAPAVPVRFVLAPDAEQHWLPFTLTPGNQIALTAAIDGHPVAAILDTGVSVSVLAQRFATAAGLAVAPGGTANAIGGAVPIGRTPTRSVALGALTRSGGTLTVAALPALATGGGATIDLLVGRDLLAGYALDIDYQGKRLRLLHSGRLPFTGFTAPLSIAADPQVYATELTLGGHRLSPVVVDTGDGSAVTVATAGWRAARLDGISTTTTLGYGLAGPVVSTLAIVPGLRIGQLTAAETEIRVEPPGGFSDAIGAAGRIGSGFLQNYRVLLDPSAGHMVLSPAPGASRAPLRSTSGLLVGVAPDKLMVIHVMRGSPAAAAGWAAGDAICTIDGKPVPADYSTNPIARWSVGDPGRRVALGLCDGPTRTLTLAQFY